MFRRKIEFVVERGNMAWDSWEIEMLDRPMINDHVPFDSEWYRVKEIEIMHVDGVQKGLRVKVEPL